MLRFGNADFGDPGHRNTSATNDFFVNTSTFVLNVLSVDIKSYAYLWLLILFPAGEPCHLCFIYNFFTNSTNDRFL